MTQYHVPLIIRGKVIEGDECTFGGRHGGASFTTPDVGKHLAQLGLTTPSSMMDMYTLRFDEVLEYLHGLGDKLVFERNPHMQQAFELSLATSGLTEKILRYFYEVVGLAFQRDQVREVAERSIGVRYLEGWVENKLNNGVTVAVRPFGARAIHVTAGNIPTVAAMSIIRSVITRSDTIIKSPSNDPLTATAIARTMIDMAPEHPLTRHLSVAYWKGGDARIEQALYQPRNIEKIVAWGGLSSIKHIAQYIQPGIDLITLDPKLSSTIVGKAGFDSESTMQEVAHGIARDAGMYNQETCTNARVVYVQSGTGKEGIALANRLGELLWDAIRALPPHLSSAARHLDLALAEEIHALQMNRQWHKVIGGGLEGAVIVSQIDEPVDFARILANRVVNLVPFDDLDTPVRAVNAYTQTIGIYPPSLHDQLRDRLSLHGAQRLVTLGFAAVSMNHGLQDSIEPLRRMCRWIVNEKVDAGVIDANNVRPV